MTKITIVLLFYSAFFFVGCMFAYYKLPEDEQAVGNILQKIAKHLEIKYSMQAAGTNVGMPDGIVELLGLDFQINHILTKDEARKILIESGEFFLSTVNADTAIRPYLKNYPFTYDNINIVLFMREPSGYNAYHPNIDTASLDGDGLSYTTTDKSEPLKYKSDVTESYQDAVNALRSKQNL